MNELDKVNLPSVIDIDWACSASITVFAEVVVEYNVSIKPIL